MSDLSPIDWNILTPLGDVSHIESFYVLGTNTDIDAGSLPEDVWNGGGVYTGFPVGAPEKVELFSSNAGDTGLVSIRGLQSPLSTRYTTELVQLNGVTPVQSVNSYYRVNQGSYISGSSTAFNLGAITCRHAVTTTNVFFIMPIGRSLSAVCGFTIPAACEAVLTWMRLQLGSSTPNDSVNASLWFRPQGVSPILPAIFPVSVAVPYVLDSPIGVRFGPGSDFIVRVLETSGSNILLTGRMNLVLRYD